MAAATSSLASNLRTVRARLAAAASRAGRDPEEVRVVAVTKGVAAVDARSIFDLGVGDLGENRVQELARKVAAVGAGPRWHFVGGLQRNKARRALRLASLVHSIDSLRLLEAVGRIADEEGVRARLLLEVNAARLPERRGFAPEAIEAGLGAARALPAISVDGLMTMAPPTPRPEETRPIFRLVRAARDRAVQAGLLPPGAALSMGMSGDFEVAVEEGATLIRVGTALFAGPV